MIESEAGLIRAAISGADVLVIELDGSKMRSIDRLFAEYQQRFSFPDYFGWNWNAFDECLGDLRWLPARKYVTIISHADQVLSNERIELGTYLRIIHNVGKAWSTTVGLGYERGHADIPFNTVLVEDK
ncbi:barstar family protein [Arthrobacter bambusae]|uniref:RNAse (Barnase) inhibitor barstar n=1 Tax=Arthrobacter bambusae TaxID=1338426 RepID=A0AAW8DL81_9MICC|nr:barstar family protein [Arthrobacter bambusae]MDP9907317.1 RNAse (barnase) inhibitor barstar [Arthrobacter bambusae]MDQ0131185.1 RNAse (barnase) inhibitor barstar [Arthrobacter bambusae]MDQ0182788.1 RNAse (barnase) inhibitor barstar [Arthrobacter bambusae]